MCCQSAASTDIWFKMADWYLDEERLLLVGVDSWIAPLKKQLTLTSTFLLLLSSSFCLSRASKDTFPLNKRQNHCWNIVASFPRWWNSVMPKARLWFRMNPELPASRAAACTTGSPADSQGEPSMKRRPLASTSASRSWAERGWRSLRDTSTTHSGRSVFLLTAQCKYTAGVRITLTHIHMQS